MDRTDVILEMLSSHSLRSVLELPHSRLREDFVLHLSASSSYDEMLSELGRFVSFVLEGWLSNGISWPHDRGVDLARRLLENSVGASAALRSFNYHDAGGARSVLDAVAAALQRDALAKYVDNKVLPLVQGLNAEESMKLASAYLSEFRHLGVELRSPALVAANWRQILRQHADLTLS